MEVGVSMGIKNQNGSLKLTVMECGCYMKELDITLNGGASWFYQVYVVHNFVLQALCFLFLWKGLSKLNFPSPATSKYETHIIAFQILFKVFSFSLFMSGDSNLFSVPLSTSTCFWSESSCVLSIWIPVHQASYLNNMSNEWDVSSVYFFLGL